MATKNQAQFEKYLETYADIVVRFGMNVQQGQRVLITTEVTPDPDFLKFIRLIGRKAFQAGATDVRALWGFPALTAEKVQHGDPATMDMYPQWAVDALADYVNNGDPSISVYAPDPDLFEGLDPEKLSRNLQAQRGATLGVIMKIMTMQYGTRGIVSGATQAWANKVFPDLPEAERLDALWNAIFKICRVDTPDPIEAYRKHNEALHHRQQILTDKQYSALKLTAPGTDLTIGLVEGHKWIGGGVTTAKGVDFMPNIPTEEVFTMPHRDRVDGVVTATMPLNYGGSIVDEFSVTFENGCVVNSSAKKGDALLKHMIATDEGASRLGEVALVPHSSPISQMGRIFYNTLFDENASCHVALGRSYPMNLTGGDAMSEADMLARGANLSAIHTDFMIGSDRMNIDGVHADGSTEAIMRGGEFVI